MAAIKEAAKDFLSLKNIAVASVSRSKENAANFIYRKLRTEDFSVFSINLNATKVKEVTWYPI
jgi:predicted CoA-binding protein